MRLVLGGRFLLTLLVAGGALFYGSGCDAVAPQSDPILVVEAFIETDESLPVIRLRQTHRMDVRYDEETAAAEGAVVQLTVPDGIVSYLPVAGSAGLYAPETGSALPENTPFEIEARWRDAIAIASGRLPEQIRLIDVTTRIPDRPVEAVLLDSLQLDSLQTGAQSGHVYPIEVSLSWARSEGTFRADSLNWIRAQLKPFTTPVPGVIELFFRSEQIIREDRVRLEGERRKWTGVYLVPVDGADDPLPEHSVKVAVLRGDADYARFASSRTAPERREPVSNVSGGIGIVAGIAVDSLTLRIR